MATLNSNDITKKKPIPGFGAAGGSIKTAYSFYDVAVGAAVADVIDFFDLPPHAIVHGVRMKNGALGASVTMNLGDSGGFDDAGVAIAADPARYLAATAVATAGNSNTIAQAGLFFNTGSRKVRVRGTLAGATVGTAGRVEVAITYTVEEPQGRTP
jgi:hypothetical protein